MIENRYIKEYVVDDIPNYPILYIRDGDFVFVTDKHTGEIYKRATLKEYVDIWCGEWETNPIFREFYTKGYFTPKHHPDTAKDIVELYKLCSDKTRQDTVKAMTASF